MKNITNPLGSIASLSAIIAFIQQMMASVLGCATSVTADIGAACTASWLDPKWALIAGGVFGAFTMIGKLTRPGGFFSSVFGSTAVIVPAAKAGVGTVTEKQVSQP